MRQRCGFHAGKYFRWHLEWHFINNNIEIKEFSKISVYLSYIASFLGFHIPFNVKLEQNNLYSLRATWSV